MYTDIEKRIIELAERNLCREDILEQATWDYRRTDVQSAFTKLRADGVIGQMDDVDRYGRKMYGVLK